MPKRPRPDEAAVNRLPELLDAIRGHAPSADAKKEVTVSAPHARSAYLSYTRLSGPREAVLGYAAYLFSEDRGHGASRLDLDAVERDENGTLTLLLSRSLYEAPEQDALEP
jgi:hypothetical protein